jgi:hypothetical protein
MCLATVRVDIDAESSYKLARFCQRRAMTKRRVYGRLIGWFATLNAEIQLELMNAKTPIHETALNRRLLHHIAAKSK